jgi:hypothetical protein
MGRVMLEDVYGSTINGNYIPKDLQKGNQKKFRYSYSEQQDGWVLVPIYETLD